MTWAALFDRATAYDVSLEDVTQTLSTHREEGEE